MDTEGKGMTMIPKIFTNTLNSLLNPNVKEIREAQEQAIERIQTTLMHAENEVAQKAPLMTEEQRLNEVENELKKTEEHLLSALGSLFKAVCYVAPPLNLRHFKQEKIIEGEIVE